MDKPPIDPKKAFKLLTKIREGKMKIREIKTYEEEEIEAAERRANMFVMVLFVFLITILIIYFFKI